MSGPIKSCMARTARASVGGVCYHVLNRGNGRAEVFHKKEDYLAFLDLMEEANERLPMRLLAWCLIPNHFHLVLVAAQRWRLEPMDAVAVDIARAARHRHYHG